MTISTSEPGGLRRALEQRAVEEGFVALGVADPRAMQPAGERLRHFVGSGRHGEMDWLADRVDRRADPLALWPEVRSVIMLQASYAPERDPLEGLRETGHGLVSAYAARRDYHDVVKGALKRLGQWLVHRAGGEIKVFTDTAPVMEKPLAALAGIGWQGKHTNLVSRAHGSWTFLGAIYTTLDLTHDRPATDHCGTCSRCLDICPTAAFPAPYQLDARRCIAYLTVEHRGQIPAEFRSAIGNRVFGCDDCLAVCPWNRFAQAVRDGRLSEREDLSRAPLGELLALDDAAFRTRFAGTPVKRLGRDRFIRNALVAAGNSDDAALVPAVERLLSDPSPLVRGMAVWALHRLDPGRAALLRSDHQENERDRDVQDEWLAGAAG